MSDTIKQIAIIGGNKEALALLPLLIPDAGVKVVSIIDANPDAMLFKLEEMGCVLADKHHITISKDLNALEQFTDLDFIVNCIDTPSINIFLRRPEFTNTEIVTPMSVRLLWSLRGSGAPHDTKRGAGQLALLSTMGEVVAAARLTQDKRELLTVILMLAIEATGAERGSIMLIDGNDDTLRVEAVRGMDLEVARKIRIPMGEGIAGQVARDKKPLLITGKAPIREIRRLHGRNDVKSALSVPLTIGEECIGVINISSSESAHAFTEEDLHFLVSLINLSAEVIYRSDEMEKIEGADRKFSLWKEVNSIMASLGPLDARLNNVCSAISDYIYGVTSSIYLYNREDAALVMKASSVKSVARVGGITLHRGEGIEGRVWKTKKSVVLVEREVEPGRHTLYLAIPMMTYGEFIGVLSVHLVLHEEPAQYIEPLLTDLATLLADNIAISNRHEESMLQSTRIVAADATGLELLSITDPDSFYDTVAATLAAIIGAEGATIRTRSHGSGKFSLRGSFGLDDFIIREYYLPIEREVLIEALASEDIVRKEIVSGESDYIHSVLAHPLTDDNKVIGGAVTLFNKSADGAIYARNFSRADMEVLKRFVPYIQQGIKMMAPCDARAREYEFITTREFFERRAAEEISRGSRLGSHFLLLALRMPGLATLSRYEGKEAVQGILSSVRARIGNFAIVAKLDEESLAILFLESDKKALRGIENILNFPGSESIFTTMNPVGGSEVCYGYARFPEDGATITKILNRAFERSHTPVVRDEGKLV